MSIEKLAWTYYNRYNRINFQIMAESQLKGDRLAYERKVKKLKFYTNLTNIIVCIICLVFCILMLAYD